MESENKFEIEFNLLDQSVDADQNPTFETQITVENIPAGSGKGYSKKESQQEAARETLSKIKSDPQFIDAILRQRLNANRRRKQRLKPMECPSRKKPFGKNCWKAKNCRKV